MCVGIPMKVVSSLGPSAICITSGGLSRSIDMTLVGEQPEGTWLLTFLEAAREVISPERAAMIDDALGAVAAIMDGGDAGDAFADLLSREPQLPPHLEAARRAGLTQA